MRRPGLVTVFAGTVLLRCSLAIDTDALVSGEGKGTPDASTSKDASLDEVLPDIAASDVASESTPDSPSEDAQTPDVVEASGSFCTTLSPTPTLCSDFDQVNLPAGWNELSQWGGGSGAIDSLESKSSPRSLLFTTPLLAAGDQCGASLVGSFAEPTTRMRLEFELFPETLFDASVDLAVFKMNASGGDDIVSLRLTKTSFDVRESIALADGGFDYAGHSVSSAPKIGVWNHIAWDISFTGQKAFSNLEVDGTVNGGGLESKSYLAPVTIQIGTVVAHGVSGPWALRVDNVVVNVD